MRGRERVERLDEVTLALCLLLAADGHEHERVAVDAELRTYPSTARVARVAEMGGVPAASDHRDLLRVDTELFHRRARRRFADGVEPRGEMACGEPVELAGGF